MCDVAARACSQSSHGRELPPRIRPVCTILLAWRCSRGRADHPGRQPRRAHRPRQRAARRPEHEPAGDGGPRSRRRRHLAGGRRGRHGLRRDQSPSGHRQAPPPDPTGVRAARSRCVAHRRRRAHNIPARLAVLGPGRYNPVNVVWVSPDRALVAEIDDTGPVRVIDLQPARTCSRLPTSTTTRPQGGDAPSGDGRASRRWRRGRDAAAHARAACQSRLADGQTGRRRMHSRRCVRHRLFLERRCEGTRRDLRTCARTSVRHPVHTGAMPD